MNDKATAAPAAPQPAPPPGQVQIDIQVLLNILQSKLGAKEIEVAMLQCQIEMLTKERNELLLRVVTAETGKGK